MRTRIQRFGLPLFVGCISVSSSLHFPGTQRREDNHNPSNHNPIPTKENEDNHNNHGTMNKALSTTARCTCGKVQFAIQTLEQSPPLRLVCYCSDCRGYYETLDRLAIEKSLPPSAILDVSFLSLFSGWLAIALVLGDYFCHAFFFSM